MVDELGHSAHSTLCREYLAFPLNLKYPDLQINELPQDDGGNAQAGEDAYFLFLNGRLLCYGDELAELINETPNNGIGVKGGYVVAAKLKREPALNFANYIKKRISDEAMGRICDELKKQSASEQVKTQTKSTDQLVMSGSPSEGTFEDDHELGQDSFQEKLPQELSALVGRHNLTLVDMKDARLLSFPWQIIEENSRVIEDDFLKLPFRGQAEESIVFTGVQMVGEENIVIGEAAVVKPGAVLDASAGPIIIGDGTMVMANVSITGPAYIGRQCLIKPGSKILEGTSVGDVCKIGGEVDGSLFAAYSNKQHDGFIGHSYIGEWVNIGAGASNSDLKNNYSPVRMWCAGSVRETGRQFLGLIMGDHTKTGINAMFNTGTVVGFNCNIFGSEPPPRFVPSFSWGSKERLTEYKLEKGMQTAEVVMERRNIKFENAHKEMFKKLFEFSQKSARNI